MSQAEYDKMIKTGQVQMSGDNKVHIANPANIDAFSKQAKPLKVQYTLNLMYLSIQFLLAAQTNGPDSLSDRLYNKNGLPRITEMPKTINIEIKGSK